MDQTDPAKISIDADDLHRLVKALADSGEAPTFEAAEALMDGYGARVVLDSAALSNPGAQIAALTVLNAAARTFRGNVLVDGPRDFVFTVRGFERTTLAMFMQWLGLPVQQETKAASWPLIEIAEVSTGRPSIRPWASGWRFGLGPDEAWDGWFPPACVAAGAIAVSEAFSVLRNDNPYAGQRALSLSLWSPSADEHGVMGNFEIPSMWLVGLGHLGQAYAWTIGFMRPSPTAVLYLQDVDVSTRSTLSTSSLSCDANIGQRKTRVVSQWLEARGYQTALIERRFDATQRTAATEPRLALFGVDNAAARRAIESAGFRRVIDAGLGSGFRDFRAIRLRTFPGPSSAASLWAVDTEQGSKPTAPAYKALLSSGANSCGVTMLASRAVGAPFVGCMAASLVLAELVRGEYGGPTQSYLDLNMRDPQAADVG